MTRRVIVEADGGSRGNPGPAGYGALVRDADTGALLREVAAGIGVASNNVAEYRGLIAGLTAAAELGASEVEVRMDSLLVVNQMSQKWQVKHEAMRPLAAEAARLVRGFERVRFVHVPRARNAHADRLANEAMDDAARGRDWVARSGVAEVPEPEPEPPAAREGGPVAGRRPANSLYGWSAPVGPPTRLLLLRHGETPLSVERRFSGHGDAALTDRGRAQARAAATRLATYGAGDAAGDAGGHAAAVVSSPLRRCRQTADVVAEALGLEVVVDDGFAETDFGAWEGSTFAEVQQRWPDELAAWLASPDVAPPGGETFTATFARVAAARERVVAAYPGQAVVVVSHVTPIKAVLREALDAPTHAVYRMHLNTASLSTVHWHADGAGVVMAMNDVSHLVGIDAGPDI